MNTKEKIINVINDGNIDDSTAKELIEGYLVDDILSEIKNNNCKLLVVSEGKKNRLNAEEVSYSLCNNDASRYNFNLATCLNDKEITDMIESAYGCNHTVLTMEVRKKLFSRITGDVELVNFNSDGSIWWLESLDILINNKQVTSINGYPRQIIEKIKGLCDSLQYTLYDKNRVFNELFDIANRKRFFNMAVEVDESGKYVVNEDGHYNIIFDKQYDAEDNNYFFPYRNIDNDNPMYDKLRGFGLDDDLISWLSIYYSDDDKALKKFLKDMAILTREVAEFTLEFREELIGEKYDELDNSVFYRFLHRDTTIYGWDDTTNSEEENEKCKTLDDLRKKYPNLTRGIQKHVIVYDSFKDFFDDMVGTAGDHCYLAELGSNYLSTFVLEDNILNIPYKGWEVYSKDFGIAGDILWGISAFTGLIDAGSDILSGDYATGIEKIFDVGFTSAISYFLPKTAAPIILNAGIACFSSGGAGILGGLLIVVGGGYLLCRAVGKGGELVCSGYSWFLDQVEFDIDYFWGESIKAHWLRDPLIIDLNGTGFVTTMNKDGVHFDLNCDGFAERINWTTENGLLALDLNGNGMIDDGGEVFGDSTLLPDGSRAKNGFEALAQYDLNKDGIIDENDEIYERLKVWVDADASGESEEGELKSLKELGIKAINLNYEAVNEKTDTEVVIGNRATYVKEDGSEMAIGEMWVAPALIDSVEKMTPEIAEKMDGLPDVRSYGTVSSLHSAMAKDETGELKKLVEQFTNADTYDEKLKITDSILYFICGVKDIDDSKMWGYAKEKELKVIERMTGEEYIDHEGSRYPNNAAGPILSELYKVIRNMYCISMVGSEASDLLKLLLVLEKDGNTEINVDMINLAIGIGYQTGSVSKRQIASVCSYLSYFGGHYLNDLTPFIKIRDYISDHIPECLDYLDANIMGAIYGTAEGERLLGNKNADLIYGLGGDDEVYSADGNDVIFGGAGNDKISAGLGDDILIGGKGNDRLTGDKGADIYIHERGDGSDIIDNRDTSTYRISDKLVLKGVKISDINIVRDGYNLLVIDKISNEIITIEGAFYSADGSQYLENIELDDGLLEKEDIEKLSLQIKGTDGNDKIIMPQAAYNYSACETIDAGDGDDIVYANVGNDVIIGGKGNDELAGGEGIDIYIHERGDGNDIIDNVDHSEYRTSDKLILKGVKAADIEIYRDGYNLVIEDKIGDETVTIKNVFHYDYLSGSACLENVELDDVTYNFEDLRRFASVIKLGDDSDYVIGNEETYAYSADETFYAGGGNDYVYGEKGDDIIHGETGDDHLFGGVGNDTIYGGEGDDTIYGDEGNDSLFGGAERDKIYAGDGNDFISGGTDNDVLEGGSGDDTYYFNLGDGIDEVTDIENDKVSFDVERYNNDRFIFGNGIKREDIVRSRHFNDLIIKYSNDDQITIKDAYDLSANHYIESFEFEDGSIMSFDEIYSGPNNQYVTYGTDTDDNIYSEVDGRAVYGLDGNDELSGEFRNSVLIGGKGNDTLRGGQGEDIYVFSHGDGVDSIYEKAYTFEEYNKIFFDESVSIDDLHVVITGHDERNLTFIYSDKDAVTVYDALYMPGAFGVDDVAFNNAVYEINYESKCLYLKEFKKKDPVTGENITVYVSRPQEAIEIDGPIMEEGPVIVNGPVVVNGPVLMSVESMPEDDSEYISIEPEVEETFEEGPVAILEPVNEQGNENEIPVSLSVPIAEPQLIESGAAEYDPSIDDLYLEAEGIVKEIPFQYRVIHSKDAETGEDIECMDMTGMVIQDMSEGSYIEYVDVPQKITIEPSPDEGNIWVCM